MNTTITSQILVNIAKSVNFAQNYTDAKENLRINFRRYKDSTPFSQRLNNWLTAWYAQHKDKFEFSEVDFFNDMSPKEAFAKMKRDYEVTGKIVIWTGQSEGTIFGNPFCNHVFRAWHDHTHIMLNQDFGFGGESVVGTAQANQLPPDWLFERELINAEILGQNQYYRQHKEFLINQRKFTVDYLLNPVTAIYTKQSGSIDLRKK